MKKIIVALIFIFLFVLTSCGEGEINTIITTLEEHHHEWDAWKVVEVASCNHDGREIRYCLSCSEFEERYTPKIEHQYDMVEVHQGDCKNPSFEKYECQICGHYYKKEFPSNVTHNYYISNTVQPYCDYSGKGYNGYTEHKCSICGHSYREVIEKTPCTMIEEKRAEPNCQEDGYILYCCMSNPEHIYVERILTTGEHVYYYDIYNAFHIKCCYYCYYRDTSTITITNPDGSTYITRGEYHVYGDWIIKEDATCFEKGSKYQICEYCKYKHYEEIPVSHKYDENGVCTECGVLKQTE